MQDLKLTAESIRDFPISTFENWYESNFSIISKIADQLNTDLMGYSIQSGANTLAFYSIRIKDKDSFIDKILSVVNDASELERIKSKYKNGFIIQDIIQDLIGARLVMYFDNDIDMPINYFDLYPAFTIDEAKIYNLHPKDSPLFDSNILVIKNRLESICTKVSMGQKNSGYESVHLIVRYQQPYAFIRDVCNSNTINLCSNATDALELTPDNSILDKFPIEIQIRTVLQHTWAQIEHKMNYNLIKRRSEVQISDKTFQDDLKFHKSLLNSAEYHQKIMYERFSKHRHITTTLTDKGIHYGNRLSYFDSAEAAEIDSINKRLHNGNSLTILNDLLVISGKLEVKYKQSFFNMSHEQEIEPWGRKRIILLIIGYLMLYSETSEQKSIYSRLKSKKLFSKNIDSSVITLFEYIRSMDTYFRWKHTSTENEKALVSDPLVAYRSAGAYIKVRNFRRGIHVMFDAIKYNFFSRQCSLDNNSNYLNKMHFLRRIGEYYFMLYLNHEVDYQKCLYEACNYTTDSIDCSDGPSNSNALADEKLKIVSNILIFNFYRYIIELKENQNIDNYKVVITKYRTFAKQVSSYASKTPDKIGKIHMANILIIYFTGHKDKAIELLKSLQCTLISNNNAEIQLISNSIFNYIEEEKNGGVKATHTP